MCSRVSQWSFCDLVYLFCSVTRGKRCLSLTPSSTNIYGGVLGFLHSQEKVIFAASFPRKNGMLLIANKHFNSRVDLLVFTVFIKSGFCEARMFSQVIVKSVLPCFGLQLWFYRNELVSGYSAAQTHNRVFMDESYQTSLQCFLEHLGCVPRRPVNIFYLQCSFLTVLFLRLLSSCIVH